MFIYVDSEAARDYLLEQGYELLKYNERGPIWVFTNKSEVSFEEVDVDVPCVVSDVLTF